MGWLGKDNSSWSSEISEFKSRSVLFEPSDASVEGNDLAEGTAGTAGDAATGAKAAGRGAEERGAAGRGAAGGAGKG